LDQHHVQVGTMLHHDFQHEPSNEEQSKISFFLEKKVILLLCFKIKSKKKRKKERKKERRQKKKVYNLIFEL